MIHVRDDRNESLLRTMNHCYCSISFTLRPLKFQMCRNHLVAGTAGTAYPQSHLVFSYVVIILLGWKRVF